jgi:hypothetical protein
MFFSFFDRLLEVCCSYGASFNCQCPVRMPVRIIIGVRTDPGRNRCQDDTKSFFASYLRPLDQIMQRPVAAALA